MPSISKENRAVTLINVFTVAPANQQKVVDLLVKATETTMKNIPGFISASIHKSVDGLRVVNYAQWRTQHDFEAMRNNPQAQAHIKPLMEISKPDFHLYDVVDTFELKDKTATG